MGLQANTVTEKPTTTRQVRASSGPRSGLTNQPSSRSSRRDGEILCPGPCSIRSRAAPATAPAGDRHGARSTFPEQRRTPGESRAMIRPGAAVCATRPPPVHPGEGAAAMPRLVPRGLWIAAAACAAVLAGAHPAFASEASLKLPSFSEPLFFGGASSGASILIWGLVVSALGMGFGLLQYVQLRNLPVHKSMLEISELIYATCQQYLVTQGRF